MIHFQKTLYSIATDCFSDEPYELLQCILVLVLKKVRFVFEHWYLMLVKERPTEQQTNRSAAVDYVRRSKQVSFVKTATS